VGLFTRSSFFCVLVLDLLTSFFTNPSCVVSISSPRPSFLLGGPFHFPTAYLKQLNEFFFLLPPRLWSGIFRTVSLPFTSTRADHASFGFSSYSLSPGAGWVFFPPVGFLAAEFCPILLNPSSSRILSFRDYLSLSFPSQLWRRSPLLSPPVLRSFYVQPPLVICYSLPLWFLERVPPLDLPPFLESTLAKYSPIPTLPS